MLLILFIETILLCKNCIFKLKINYLLFLAFIKDYDNAISCYYNWLKRETLPVDYALRVISLYDSALKGMSSYLVASITKFDVFLIIVSIILSIQVKKFEN